MNESTGEGIVVGAPSDSGTLDVSNAGPQQSGVLQQETSQNQEGKQEQQGGTELPPGAWQWMEGVVGNGDKPEWVLDKYGNDVSKQAKAYPDAEKKIGELSQRLGAFKGAPDKYDFSDLEKDGFTFDSQDKLYGEFVTECQNNNVSQEFATKVASFAKSILRTPETNLENEVKTYGESFDEDKKNVQRWIGNNNAESDSKELMESVKSAGALRALRNLMNSNGFNVPTGAGTYAPPKETLSDLKSQFAQNLYAGDDLANNPEKAQEWMDKFNKMLR